MDNKLKHLPTAEDTLVDEYGAKVTVSRDEFDAKFQLKNAVKQPE